MTEVQFRLNGKPVACLVEADEVLVDTIRQRFGLTIALYGRVVVGDGHIDQRKEIVAQLQRKVGLEVVEGGRFALIVRRIARHTKPHRGNGGQKE